MKSGDQLSFLKQKKLKKPKIKFKIKIEFCRIQGNNLLITEILRSSNEYVTKKFNFSFMLLAFLPQSLFFQFYPPLYIKMQLGSNLVLKKLNVQKIKVEGQTYFFKIPQL